MSQQIGFAAEEHAKIYLQNQGLRLVVANYHSRMGELDLIMTDGAYLVFIEVRARSSSRFGGALASVDAKKRLKLIKTAQTFLMKNRRYQTWPIRFDVVSLQGKGQNIQWVKDAFGLDY